MSVEYQGKEYFIEKKSLVFNQGSIKEVSLPFELPELEYNILNLSEIGITNISDIKGLEKLINLQVLILSNNHIAEINGLGTLSNLLFLDMSKNQISEIKNLENLKKLEILKLFVNNISEIKGFENLVKLEYLNLGKNQIFKIQNLAHLYYLDELNLSFNNITEIAGLENLNNLKWLYLRGNQIEEINELKLPRLLTNIQIGDNPINSKVKNSAMNIPNSLNRKSINIYLNSRNSNESQKDGLKKKIAQFVEISPLYRIVKPNKYLMIGIKRYLQNLHIQSNQIIYYSGKETSEYMVTSLIPNEECIIDDTTQIKIVQPLSFYNISDEIFNKLNENLKNLEKPESWLQWHNLAAFNANRKLIKVAETHLKKAVELFSDKILLFFNLGNMSAEMKKYDEAKYYYKKTIELNPMFISPWISMGNLYLRKKKYKEAEYYQKKAIELSPISDQLWVYLSEIYNAQKKYRKAEECIIKALRVKFGNPYTLNILGEIYSAQNKLEDAERCYYIAKELRKQIKKQNFNKKRSVRMKMTEEELWRNMKFL